MGANHYLVSVSMAVYNSKDYIRQAIESVLAQKTTFPFQLVIADDHSTDGTVEILEEYAAKHDNIKLILHKNNSIYKNYTDLYDSLRTKYVAFCDGDDFWTDENKLQTQVDFLEANPDFMVAAHKTEVLLEGAPDSPYAQPIYKRNASKKSRETGILHADELADNYYLHVSSYVLRWLYTDGLPSGWEMFMTNDIFLLLAHAAEGKVKYFDKAMSVWRRHHSGTTALQTQKPSLYVREKWDDFLELQTRLDAFFEGRFSYQLRERVRFAIDSVVKECAASGDWGMLDFFLNKYPGFFKDALNKWEDIVGAVHSRPKEIEATPFPIKKDFRAIAEPKQETRITMGGAIPLDLEMIPETGDSVWNTWTYDAQYACYHNYESALSHIVWNSGLRVWLPHYCSTVARRLNTFNNSIRNIFYQVTKSLRCADTLFSQFQSGDIVITHSYFGRPLAQKDRERLEARDDIIWIEDRSDMLDNPQSKARYVIYNAPSVVGVPDGAIVLAGDAFEWSELPRDLSEERTLERLKNAFLNYEIEGRNFDDARTFPAEQQNLKLSLETMSKTSKALLKRLSWPTISLKRKGNWKILYQFLKDYALWPMETPDFTPAAFPLLVPAGQKSCRLASFLADEGVLGSTNYDYTAAGVRMYESSLGRLFAVPCSHDYSPEQTEEVAKKILKFIRKIY